MLEPNRRIWLNHPTSGKAQNAATELHCAHAAVLGLMLACKNSLTQWMSKPQFKQVRTALLRDAYSQPPPAARAAEGLEDA